MAPEPGCGRYSLDVVRLFRAARYAGDVAAGSNVVTGSAAEGGSGARVRLTAAIESGRFARLRFRCFGCPHLIAAAEWLCASMEGRPLAEATDFAASALVERLDVPPEKLGRLLLLEDALAALQRGATEIPAKYLESDGEGPQDSGSGD